MTEEMEALKRRLVVGRKSDGRCRYDEQAKLRISAHRGRRFRLMVDGISA